jgi:hypothetical protein
MMKWRDLIESKRSYKRFALGNEEEQRIAECDKDFFSRALATYVA